MYCFYLIVQMVFRFFLLSRVMILSFFYDIGFCVDCIDEYNDFEKKEIKEETISHQWFWKGCSSFITNINNSTNLYDYPYNLVVLVGSILGQECCKVLLVLNWLLDNYKEGSSEKGNHHSFR